MAYRSDIVEQAKSILRKREQKAQYDLEDRQEIAYEKCPELLEIKKKLALAGIAVAKIMLEGGDPQDRVEKIAKENLALQARRQELLKQNGFPEDYLKPKFFCDKCEDTGFVNGKICDCHKKLLRQISFEKISEISAIRTSSFDNFNLGYYPDEPDAKTGISPRRRMREILNYCKCYADDFSSKSDSIFMYGATGLGKTHLSLAIAAKAIEKGYDVIYCSAPNLLSKLESEKFGRNPDSVGAEEAILDCDLLIIDDLGAEFSTQFTVSAIYNIINTRITYHKPVIISTNLTSQELEAKYSERITSRIIGCYTDLLFLGRDVRQIMNFE